MISERSEKYLVDHVIYTSINRSKHFCEYTVEQSDMVYKAIVSRNLLSIVDKFNDWYHRICIIFKAQAIAIKTHPCILAAQLAMAAVMTDDLVIMVEAASVLEDFHIDWDNQEY
jgi:hypothetical protein